MGINNWGFTQQPKSSHEHHRWHSFVTSPGWKGKMSETEANLALINKDPGTFLKRKDFKDGKEVFMFSFRTNNPMDPIHHHEVRWDPLLKKFRNYSVPDRGEVPEDVIRDKLAKAGLQYNPQAVV